MFFTSLRCEGLKPETENVLVSCSSNSMTRWWGESRCTLWEWLVYWCHLELQLKAEIKEYDVNCLDDTSDFVSPDDFDGVEVILDYYKLKSSSLLQTEMWFFLLHALYIMHAIRKTVACYVLQNIPLEYWVNLQLYAFNLCFHLKHKRKK